MSALGKPLLVQRAVAGHALASVGDSPNTMTVPSHWPPVSGWANRMQERRMEMNCRVVMTVANSSAPKVLMVWLQGGKRRV